jgi:hypothetical protein
MWFTEEQQHGSAQKQATGSHALRAPLHAAPINAKQGAPTRGRRSMPDSLELNRLFLSISELAPN